MVPDAAIDEYLARHGIVENMSEAQKRSEVFGLLQALMVDLCRRVATERNLRRDDFRCQLMPFGSFGLGGYTRGADMDLVCIGAIYVTRDDFFRVYPSLMRRTFSRSDLPHIEIIRKTNVPIIKCKILSIDVDISYVQTRLGSVPEMINLLDDTMMEELDETSVASMDGPRTLQFIKGQIRLEDMPVFRRTLQCIKHWATRRQLYGKPMGYLNGSTWTFLLVYTYIDFDRTRTNSNRLSTFNLLCLFFSMWARWKWPRPVVLTDVIPDRHGQRVDYHTLSEFQDAQMPIVSPCYPVSSCAPFVTRSSLVAIQREFARAEMQLKTFHDGYDRLEESKTKQMTRASTLDSMLDHLFKPLDLVDTYKHFMRVIVLSDTVKSHEIWIRRLARHVPRLVEFLEQDPHVALARPIPNPINADYRYRTDDGRYNIIEGRLADERSGDSYTGELNPGTLYTTTYLICLEPKISQSNGALHQQQPISLDGPVAQFLCDLEDKKHSKDRDVRFNITMASRQEVAEMLQQEQQRKHEEDEDEAEQ
ncbi:Poly(A) polymerase central domain-domain-containing protein [Syncephalastrum racemosum]|uniref:polynucleotide adenylyltransferase n=1 Tax=Syncephalastrum racemosum TaxID=13706 RepID=A0A1X2H6X4_SYNRA|nr:Poly(A) polymerase central domain-domain-containing protein [Syncephalastrum racemosum]